MLHGLRIVVPSAYTQYARLLLRVPRVGLGSVHGSLESKSGFVGSLFVEVR